jgi:hypothetical protein
MPSGFQPIGSVQYEPDGKVYMFDVPASHASLIAVGDVVRMNGNGTALTSVPQVDVATAGQTITGVVVAIAPQFSTENLTAGGLPASTFGTVVVCTDPGMFYNVAVSGGPLTVADVHLNIDIAATAATLQGSLAVSNMTVNQHFNSVSRKYYPMLLVCLVIEQLYALTTQHSLLAKQEYNL